MRREFPKAIKVASIKANTRDNVTYCEGCGLPAKRFHFDHRNPDGLTGQPTLENCQLLCEPCHAEKTKQDVANIAKAKRREASHLGVRSTPKLQSAGFQRTAPQRRASRKLDKWAAWRDGI